MLAVSAQDRPRFTAGGDDIFLSVLPIEPCIFLTVIHPRCRRHHDALLRGDGRHALRVPPRDPHGDHQIPDPERVLLSMSYTPATVQPNSNRTSSAK